MKKFKWFVLAMALVIVSSAVVSAQGPQQGYWAGIYPVTIVCRDNLGEWLMTDKGVWLPKVEVTEVNVMTLPPFEVYQSQKPAPAMPMPTATPKPKPVPTPVPAPPKLTLTQSKLGISLPDGSAGFWLSWRISGFDFKKLRVTGMSDYELAITSATQYLNGTGREADFSLKGKYADLTGVVEIVADGVDDNSRFAQALTIPMPMDRWELRKGTKLEMVSQDMDFSPQPFLGISGLYWPPETQWRRYQAGSLVGAQSAEGSWTMWILVTSLFWLPLLRLGFPVMRLLLHVVRTGNEAADRLHRAISLENPGQSEMAIQAQLFRELSGGIRRLEVSDPAFAIEAIARIQALAEKGETE